MCIFKILAFSSFPPRSAEEEGDEEDEETRGGSGRRTARSGQSIADVLHVVQDVQACDTVAVCSLMGEF